MDERPQPIEMIAATVEEVAGWLSFCEGREVSIHEVRRIEASALQKLRQLLRSRGLTSGDFLPME